MPVIGVLGAKGGCGASLTATNLSVAMARQQELVLLDLNPLRGCDDMLLGLSPGRSWADLLPVAQELQDTHLQKVLFPSRSRLRLLLAPEVPLESEAYPQVKAFVLGLRRLSALLIIDLPSGNGALTKSVLPSCDLILLVSTPDAPALRAANRWAARFPRKENTRAGLILNQTGPDHPIQPSAVAASLGLSLLGILPKDLKAVGGQLAFGQPAVLTRDSPLGRAILSLATRVSQQLSAQDQNAEQVVSNPLPPKTAGIPGEAGS